MNSTKEKCHYRKISVILCFILAISMIFTGCGDATSDGEMEAPKDKYGFVVLNQNGEVVSGAEVTFNGESLITGDDGTVTFDKPEAETVSLSVTCTNFYDYQETSYQVKEGAADSIVIKSKDLASHHLKTAIYTNPDAAVTIDVDLLTKYKMVNKSTDNLDFDIETTVLGDSDMVSKYELHQDVEDEDRVIAESTDGNFRNLKVADFRVGTNIYVTVYDKENHQTSTSLNFEVGEDPNITEHSELSLGDGISFDVADDIPIFGGSTFKLAFPAIPLDYKVSEDKVHIGFNVDEDTFDDEAQMKEYKKVMSELIRTKYAAKNYKTLVEKMKKRQKKNGIMRLSGFDSGVDVSVGGYAEAGFDSYGKLSSGTGYLCVTVTASAEFDWQVIVWLIPVTIDIEGKVEVNLSGSISYSFNDNKFSGEAAIQITPSLTAKAGVGFEFLSAGVYGSAGLDTKLILASLSEDPGFSYLNLTSSIGVYAKVAFFEPEHDLLTGTFNLWTRNKTETKTLEYNDESSDSSEISLNTGSLYSGLYDTDNYKPINEEDPITLQTMSSDGYDVLAGNINSGSTPVSASNGETALTAFTSQLQMGDAQSTYSKMYYSYYKDGYWSNGSLLDNEEKNQMNPKIYTDGKDYYLLYQEADFDNSLLNDYSSKTQQEKQALMKQAFLNFDIHVKKFDETTSEFIDMGCINTPGLYDYTTGFTMNNGIPYVYSATNNTGDFFGTNEGTKNSINCSAYENGTWNTKEIESDLNSITQLEAGVANGKTACVYSVDTDNDLTTSDDVATYFHDGNLTKITDGNVTQIMNKKLPAAKTKQFLLAMGDGLYALNSDHQLNCILKDTTNYNGKYAISDLAVYDTKNTGSGTEVYGYYQAENGTFSAPVCVTSDEKWKKDISAFTMNGQDQVVGLSEDYKDSDITTQLVSYSVKKYLDLSVDEVYINYDDVLTKSELPVDITLKNQGNLPISAESIEIQDADGNNLEIAESDYSIALDPGESNSLQIHVRTNSDTKYGSWTFTSEISDTALTTEVNQMSVSSTQEENMQNNSYEYSTGYSDFAITAEMNDTGAYPFLMVEVKNNGNIEDSAQLQLLDANDTSKELKSYGISNLGVGETKIYKIKIQDDWADENGKLALLAKVNGDEEIYTFNNYEYAYATLNYGTYNITYNYNGGDNDVRNPLTYTTAKSVKFENPVKENCTFAGWYTTPTFDTVTQVTGLPVGSAGDINLYAKWIDNDQEDIPSESPTIQPTNAPTVKPSNQPSIDPTDQPGQLSGVLGDGDNDGFVTLNDAKVTLKAALKISIVSSDVKKQIDVDGDNVISLADAKKILRVSLKIDSFN